MEFLTDVIEHVSNNSGITFLLIGDGPYRELLTERFNEVVLAPGYVPYSEIDRYYKAADVYAHPSQYEGIPLVILEALSTSLPVIARQAGDIESVTPNVVESPEEMAHRILYEEYDAEWLNRERFTIEYQQRTIERILSQIMN